MIDIIIAFGVGVILGSFLGFLVTALIVVKGVKEKDGMNI